MIQCEWPSHQSFNDEDIDQLNTVDLASPIHLHLSTCLGLCSWSQCTPLRVAGELEAPSDETLRNISSACEIQVRYGADALLLSHSFGQNALGEACVEQTVARLRERDSGVVP